jgi:hypothetical protein
VLNRVLPITVYDFGRKSFHRLIHENLGGLLYGYRLAGALETRQNSNNFNLLAQARQRKTVRR